VIQISCDHFQKLEISQLMAAVINLTAKGIPMAKVTPVDSMDNYKYAAITKIKAHIVW